MQLFVYIFTNKLLAQSPKQHIILKFQLFFLFSQVKLLMLRVSYNRDGLYCLTFADAMGYLFCEQAIEFMNGIMRSGEIYNI